MGEEGTTAGLDARIDTNDDEEDAADEKGNNESEEVTEEEIGAEGATTEGDGGVVAVVVPMNADDVIMTNSLLDAEVEKELDGVRSAVALNFARETLESAAVSTRFSM